MSMVQENTSDTGADTRIVDYPTPSPLNRIGIKVALGLGLLLSLFVIAALVSLMQARIVDENVREITEVEEPTSAAAYEMEINAIGTGLGVLKYLQTGDEMHRQRVAKDEADFERFKAQYDLLAETPRDKELGAQVSLLYQEYKALGDTLMDQADRRATLSTTIGGNFEELDDILDDQIQPSIRPHDGPEEMRKLHAALEMEINTNGVAKDLGYFLLTHDTQYEERVRKDAEDFQRFLGIYRSLSISAQEQQWVAEIDRLFGETVALARQIIDLEADIAANLAEFVDLREKLDVILDDEIQVLAHHDLAEATQVAHDMEARTTIVVMVLLLVGLASGTLVAVAITRGITGPVGKLVSASRAIARGDLSQRANIQSKDEFGILGESFNEMISQRQRAYEELEARVQERTAELSQVNEVMDLADEVGRIVTSTLNIDEVFEKFAFEVKKLVDFDRLNINLIDQQVGVLTVKYLVGEDLPGRHPGRVRPLEGTRTQHVIETGQTIVRADFAAESRFVGDSVDAEVGLRSGIMVPLVSKGQIISTMGLRSRKVDAYGP